jgi:hypothetical protein
MRLLSQIALGCSYMIALVLVIGWATGALRDIDTRASWSIIAALGCVVICGFGAGLVTFLLNVGRQGQADLPDLGRSVDESTRY